MANVHTRVLLAIGAWLLGVGAATGGSLVAVSLIGQSIDGPPTRQLTVAAVNRALAVGERDSDSPPAASPSATAGHQAATATPRAPSGPAATAPPAGTLLSSAGGSVLARCGPTGAYLISWSPQQGYAADEVVRGPAAAARVLFAAGHHGVRMVVSCTGSVPSASVTAAGGDDGGESGGN